MTDIKYHCLSILKQKKKNTVDFFSLLSTERNKMMLESNNDVCVCTKKKKLFIMFVGSSLSTVTPTPHMQQDRRINIVLPFIQFRRCVYNDWRKSHDTNVGFHCELKKTPETRFFYQRQSKVCRLKCISQKQF